MIVTESRAYPREGVGLPDYSAAKPTGAVPIGPLYTSTDIAELAARLGSPVRFDRRGSVIWLYDFSSGLVAPFNVTGGVGRSFNISAEYPFTGSFHGLMATPAVAGSYCGISRGIPYPAATKIGFEICFASPSNWGVAGVNNAYFDIFLNYYDKTTAFQSQIRILDRDGTELRFMNSVGGLETFDTETKPYRIIAPYHFSHIKLVVDMVTGKYVRFIFDNQEFDLSDELSFSFGSVVDTPYISINFHNTAELDVIAYCLVDSVIVTYSEPPND